MGTWQSQDSSSWARQIRFWMTSPLGSLLASPKDHIYSMRLLISLVWLNNNRGYDFQCQFNPEMLKDHPMNGDVADNETPKRLSVAEDLP